MIEKIIQLASKLISFKTTEQNEVARKACFDFICNYLSGSNLIINRIKTSTGNGLFIRNKKQPIEICFSGHIDVVSANEKDFNPRIFNGNIIGRGAIDMKSSVAVMVELFKQLPGQAKSVGLILVDDEEKSSGVSTKEIIKNTKLNPKITIVGEQTDFNLVIKQKGTINVVLSSKGKSAHGSEPNRGVNAIDLLYLSIDEIRQLDVFNKVGDFVPTFVLSTIKGGEASNSVPEKAEATINIRYTNFVESEIIKKKLDSLKSNKISIDYIIKPCWETEINNVYLERLKQLTNKFTNGQVKYRYASTGSDAKYFAQAGLPVVVFGPIGDNYHANNEWVNINSLENYFNILKNFII